MPWVNRRNASNWGAASKVLMSVHFVMPQFAEIKVKGVRLKVLDRLSHHVCHVTSCEERPERLWKVTGVVRL